MAKYGATYMSCYDGPEYSFDTIALSAATFVTLDPAGTAIGTLSGMADAEDSTLSLVDANGNPDTSTNFQLDGTGLEVGAAGAVLEAGTYDVIVRETNPWVAGQYQDTVFEITVTAE